MRPYRAIVAGKRGAMRQVLRLVLGSTSTIVLAGVVIGYGGALVAALDLIAHFRLHLLILCAPIALAALMLRCWQALWRTVVGALLAIAGLHPLWETDVRPSAGLPVVIMTANLYQHNPVPDAMRQAIVSADADILVTNETTKSTQTGPNALTRLYPYRLSLQTRGQTLRTVLWSKFPIRQGKLLLEDLVGPTGALGIVTIAPGREIAVVGLHMAHAAVGNQHLQIEALDEILRGLPEPRVVMGDLNATPWSHAVRRIERLTGTQRIPGYRVTWNGGYPTTIGDMPSLLGQPIDQILVSTSVGIDRIETLAIPGSDHRAVRAVIRIPVP